MSNEAAFVAFWQREFPDIACPPLPRTPSELGLTQQMAMRAQAPELYTSLFAGSNDVRLPADVSQRLNTGTLEPRDAAALHAAGLEVQAQQCERLQQLQTDQRLADQALASRQNFEASRQHFAQYNSMSLLERLGHAPLSAEQIAANRRKYGISED